MWKNLFCHHSDSDLVCAGCQSSTLPSRRWRVLPAQHSARLWYDPLSLWWPRWTALHLQIVLKATVNYWVLLTQHIEGKSCICLVSPDRLESCVSLQWRWRAAVSAVSHTGWLQMDLLGKHTPAPFLWCHWTHTFNTASVWTDTHTHHLGLLCCFPSYLLLSQNLMTLFWLLCRWVSIMRLNRVSFCSCPSITIRPRKNQWRLCSLGYCSAKKKDFKKSAQEQKLQRQSNTGKTQSKLVGHWRVTNPPVGLSQVKTLHTSGVPFDPLEHRCVIVQVPGVKGQTCVRNNTRSIGAIRSDFYKLSMHHSKTRSSRVW